MKKTWKTKEGKKLKIKDMTTGHIQNCIKLLEKYDSHCFLNAYKFLDSLHGEIAIETMENNIASAEENGYINEEAQEYIESFENELQRRKNEIK